MLELRGVSKLFSGAKGDRRHFALKAIDTRRPRFSRYS